MRLFILIVFALIAVFLGHTAPAQAQTPAPAPTNTAAVTLDLGKYADLHRQQIELSAQWKLLRELSDEHFRRVAEAERANQSQKAKWENALALELTTRATELSARAEDVTRQRLALEEREKPAPAAVRLNPEESAYLSRIDTMIWELDQELKLAQDAVKTFTSQLLTNTEAADVAQISFDLQQNNQAIRFLERDRATLELKKLEYRALRRKD